MQKKTIDTTLMFLVLALVIFGMVMISSVSVYSSFRVTEDLVKRGILGETNNYFYLARNIMHVAAGIIMMIIFSKIPYHFLEKYARQGFFLTLMFLGLVFVIGETHNGATGWIDIPGLPSIQPVELMKVALIVMLAYFLKKRKALMSDPLLGFLSYFFYVGLVFGLLVFQPDFGSILILAPVSIALYYIGGGNIRYIMLIVLVGFIGAISVYFLGKIRVPDTIGNNRNPIAYISQRIDNFFRSSTEILESNSRENKDYQIKQGLIAIGSGGFFGLGFGKSIQKFGYLPEVQGDFIFSVIVEELGFLGACLLFIIFVSIMYRGFYIARSVKDLFAKYLAMGITIWIFAQAAINIGVNLNIVPLTGVTLPFVSYGGTSLFSLMIAVGILLSISRHMEYTPQNLSDILHSRRRVIF